MPYPVKKIANKITCRKCTYSELLVIECLSRGPSSSGKLFPEMIQGVVRGKKAEVSHEFTREHSFNRVEKLPSSIKRLLEGSVHLSQQPV